uniref:Uncharacterized protein n=1 Tax=Strigamia maritima TaxID=126957 RepID=T1ISJ1_STRMM
MDATFILESFESGRQGYYYRKVMDGCGTVVTLPTDRIGMQPVGYFPPFRSKGGCVQSCEDPSKYITTSFFTQTVTIKFCEKRIKRTVKLEITIDLTTIQKMELRNGFLVATKVMQPYITHVLHMSCKERKVIGKLFAKDKPGPATILAANDSPITKQTLQRMDACKERRSANVSLICELTEESTNLKLTEAEK